MSCPLACPGYVTKAAACDDGSVWVRWYQNANDDIESPVFQIGATAEDARKLAALLVRTADKADAIVKESSCLTPS